MLILVRVSEGGGAVGAIVIGRNGAKLGTQLLRLMIAAPCDARREDVEKCKAVMLDGELHQLRRPLHIAGEPAADPRRAKGDGESAWIDGDFGVAVHRRLRAVAG